jgi:DNA-binding YbaB/EbfC family protein
MKNMRDMLKQAQQMQAEMQKKLEETVVEASAGGGMIQVRMNGNKQLLSIEIDPEVFGGGDRDMLQDLIVAAVNEASRRVDEAMASQLGNLASGLKLPGLG